MKKRKNRKSWICGTLMAVAVIGMAIFLTQAPAQGVEQYRNCAGDADCDGFSDSIEASGFCLTDGTFITTDPYKKDLFVILVPAATGSLLPSNPTGDISQALANGGLPVNVHVLTVLPSQYSTIDPTGQRLVAFPGTLVGTPGAPGSCGTPKPPTAGGYIQQKAVKVTECVSNCNVSSSVVGASSSQHGTPNDTDLSTVYTGNISSLIQTKCSPYCSSVFDPNNPCTKCVDKTGTIKGGYALREAFIKETVAHEIAHQAVLTNAIIPASGEYHYAAGTLVILDQVVTVSTSNKLGAVFTLGTTFTSTDQDYVKLR